VTISIRPQHYASGLGVNPDTNLTHQQLREYILMAVADDYTCARQVVSTVKSGAKTDTEVNVEQQRLDRWSQLATSAGAQATPMTYQLGPDRKQFLVIAAGGHATLRSKMGDHVVAFTLP